LPNTGSSGQRLRRSRAGAICQKWRDNDKESRKARGGYRHNPRPQLSFMPFGGMKVSRNRIEEK